MIKVLAHCGAVSTLVSSCVAFILLGYRIGWVWRPSQLWYSCGRVGHHPCRRSELAPECATLLFEQEVRMSSSIDFQSPLKTACEAGALILHTKSGNFKVAVPTSLPR